MDTLIKCANSLCQRMLSHLGLTKGLGEGRTEEEGGEEGWDGDWQDRSGLG